MRNRWLNTNEWQFIQKLGTEKPTKLISNIINVNTSLIIHKIIQMRQRRLHTRSLKLQYLWFYIIAIEMQQWSVKQAKHIM